MIGSRELMKEGGGRVAVVHKVIKDSTIAFLELHRRLM